MALKILTEEKSNGIVEEINYPCLMECIDPNPLFIGHICVVLALSENSGIAMINTYDPRQVGVLGYDWLPFNNTEYWKPYNKPITFCNV